MPAKSKLTEKVITQIETAIALGHKAEHAAQVAGISRQTYYNWLDAGKAGKSPEYVEFWKRIEQAKSQAYNSATQSIFAAGKADDWRALAWWLERLNPDEFRRVSETQVEGSGAGGQAALFILPANGREAPTVDESEIDGDEPEWDLGEIMDGEPEADA